MYLFCKKIISKVLVTCCITLLLHAGIENLNGTYSSLSPEYRKYSILHGAIAVETGWIRNVYDYDQPTESIPAPLGDIVRALYHRAEATGEVPLAMAIVKTDPKVVVQQIAEVIFNLGKKKFEVKQHDEGTVRLAKAGLEVINKAKEINENATRTVFLSVVWVLGKDHREVLQAFYGKIEELIHPSLTTTSASEDSLEKKIKSIKAKATKLVLEKAKKAQVATPKAFLPRSSESSGEGESSEKAISAAAKSEQPVEANIAASYAKATPFSIADVATYYKELDTWAATAAAEKNIENVPALVEKVVFLSLLPGKFPPHVPYAQAQIPNESERESFTDCMETMCRNFMNVLWYDQDSGKFSKEHFGTRSTTSPSTELLTFYEHHQDTLTANSFEAHSSWAALVSAIPDAKYINMRKMPLKSYELEPSLKNFIIVMHHLLNFKPFTQAELANQTFVEQFFPELCEKLKITFQWSSEQAKNIDQCDQEKKTIIITHLNFFPELPDYTHLLETSRGHGEFSENNEKTVFTNLKTVILEEHSPTISPLALWLFGRENREIVAHALADYSSLYYLPIGDPDFIARLILDIANKKIIIGNHASDILEQAARKIPDEAIKSITLLAIHRINVQEGRGYKQASDAIQDPLQSKDEDTIHAAIKVLIELVNKGQNYETAIAIAQNLTNVFAVDLFQALFAQGQGFAPAIATAQSGIHSEDRKTRFEAIELLKSLVEKEYYTEAIVAIQPFITRFNENLRHVLRLLKLLVEKEQTYEQAIAAALIDLDGMGYFETFDLFQTLFEKNQGYQQAINYAYNNLYAHNEGIKRHAERLTATLNEYFQTHPDKLAAYLSEHPKDKGKLWKLGMIGFFRWLF